MKVHRLRKSIKEKRVRKIQLPLIDFGKLLAFQS